MTRPDATRLRDRRKRYAAECRRCYCPDGCACDPDRGRPCGCGGVRASTSRRNPRCEIEPPPIVVRPRGWVDPNDAGACRLRDDRMCLGGMLAWLVVFALSLPCGMHPPAGRCSS